MNGTFYMPTKLVCGKDCVQENANLFKQYGPSCLIVTGAHSAKASGALADVTKALEQQGITYHIYDGIKQNPLLEECLEAGLLAAGKKSSFIIGIGGGSPLDAAKAVAVYAANPGLSMMDIFDYKKWGKQPLPVLVVGTTAGTGSEVTPFAIMTTPEGIKRSIAHPACFPSLAFGDAKYTASLGRPFTISTALDAFSHAVEAYFSTVAGDLSDLFALKAITVLCGALDRLRQGGEIPMELREKLYRASLLAGFSLAQCGTCYCHSLGYFLTEEHGIAHGTACAVFLPGFIKRASGKMPDRAAAFFEAAGRNEQEICNLISELTGPVDVKIDDAKVQSLAGRVAGSPNLVRTAPDGMDAAEAEAVLRGLFQ